jgi:hypothetical protein
MAAEVAHLGLEATAELLHEAPGSKAVLRRRVPPVLEADGHYSADHGTADGPCPADAAAETTGDPGDGFILDPQFLAHGQQNRLRSIVAAGQQFLGSV